KVILNEVMSSNKGSVIDPNGNYSDWLELYNTTDEDVDVSGCGLSDDMLGGVKWVIPSGTVIPANGHLVIYCSGNADEGRYFASFKLSATDELVLFDSSGHVMDSLALRGVNSGCTLARSESGEWVENTAPSPGFENTEAGAAAYREALTQGVDIGVVINEFMASNSTTVLDKHGGYSDWIELYNMTDAPVDLSGCGLSDSISTPMRWQFPSGTVIPAKGYLLIFLSGENSTETEDELHAPFGLRAYEEAVVLTASNGMIADSYEYSRQEADKSMARTPDGTGEFTLSARPTPGYPNTDAGFTAFEAANLAARGDLVITEAMNNNESTVKGQDGYYYDWIELHNRGSETINLSGYALSDNANNPAKWVFPETSIAPGEYKIILASENDVKDTKKKYLETNFALSSGGDVVFLFDDEGVCLDKLSLGMTPTDVSIGRTETALCYYESPTPGAKNGSGKAGMTTTPVLVTTPGIFDSEITVELSAAEGETIHYTLDATDPTASSAVYTGPITVSKNTVVRAISVKENYITGYSASGTYLFTTDGVDHALPVVTLVTDPDNLWNNQTGIYAYGENYDPDAASYADMLTSALYYQAKFASEAEQDEWERDGSIGVFDESGTQVFTQNIGLRIAGSFGRGRAQKGFNIIARSEYGDNRMDYAFFDTRDFTEYKAIVLRAGAQDQSRGKIRDELCTGLLEGTDVNVLYQAYEPYVLYLNGEYWGVYFMKEKRDRFFVAQHEGVTDADNMDIGYASAKVTYGSNEEWKELMNFVKTNDLSVRANYEHVCSEMDVESFMDYMICEIYVGNSDYANIQYYKLPGGKWKWIFYDFCWGFNDVNHTTLKNRRGSQPAASDLFNALLKNDEWREAFLRRFAEIMDTVFAPERVNAHIDELYAAVEPEMQREREKFNSETFMGEKQHSMNIASYEGFERQIDSIRNFANKRPEVMKKQIQEEFGLSDSYMQEVFG
ncbi:MAG: lamin tail domain-containing protein, partial [Clostridia bacterium]|nr:lamin tail domain-containing protein [Clostridia bacterium]